MQRRYIQEQWNKFAAMVLPKDCSDVQRQEMRKAFYAGCDVLLRVILGNLTEGSEAQEADLTMMNDIEAEIRDFAKRIQTGAV